MQSNVDASQSASFGSSLRSNLRKQHNFLVCLHGLGRDGLRASTTYEVQTILIYVQSRIKNS